ncbi:MAG: DUF5103 domain-containing protein [Bacteroidales bacterium]|nr:DUF5103 domain-containing protein [Bacteroidales bacterium]
MMKPALFSILMTVVCLSAFAQPDLGQIRMDDRVYVEGIKSITMQAAGLPLSEPIMELNGGGITLTFDDLEEESRYLKYTIIHCSHDWKPSDMNPIEYIDGFLEDNIETYNYSFNTVVHYMQYQLDFPTDNMRPTRSGNYILFVYDESPDQPVLTRRFMVVESEPVGIHGNLHASSVINDRFTHQEVDFTVTTGPYVIRDPIMSVRATIKQNGRWDNAIYGLTYRSGFPGELSFDFDDGRNTFPGGAEFRTFDISTLRSNADRIVGITFEHHQNQAYVLQDDARPFGAYESRNTLNGACLYHNADMRNDFSEDYVNTHFTLMSNFPFQDGDVYVFGQLTDWRILPEAKLHFNENYNYWETDFFIKQGLYNYQYVYVPRNNKNVVDATYIEGSHYETRNQYTILLYFHEEGSSYDKLIGVGHVKGL